MRPDLSGAVLVALALACASALAQPADAQSAVLADLSRLMGDVRANPAKAKTAKCPPNTNALVGVPIGRVLIELGQAEGPQKPDSLAYRIGALELAFRFNGQGAVSAVECRPAR